MRNFLGIWGWIFAPGFAGEGQFFGFLREPLAIEVPRLQNAKNRGFFGKLQPPLAGSVQKTATRSRLSGAGHAGRSNAM
ncbi:MAG: hypothetical protein JSR55_10405 [Proteobacteria bacterium]|nr:hypothetical protein [Pseudomonadota bacterium]